MNKVILMGRLTKEPNVIRSAGTDGLMVARYTLAVDRRVRRSADGQNTDFISCVSFGRNAEFAEKYLNKGIKVVVTGRIQTGSYTNREGQRIFTTDIVVDEQEFAESKKASDASNQNHASGSSYGAGKQYGYSGGNSGFGTDANGFMSIPDGLEDELPFA